MFKITVFATLVVIASVVSALSASSCQSCGAECVSACGTRHFRTCCFNYLRRKRGPDAAKFSLANLQGFKVPDGVFSLKSPGFFPDDPENWSVMPSGYKPSYFDDMIENGLQSYDV